MNVDLLFEIADMALSLARDAATGAIEGDLSVEAALLELAETTARAYEKHIGVPTPIRVGQPLALIKR